MTLEEAIKHAEEVAKDYNLKSELCTLKDGVVYPLSEEERQKCKACAEEHRQLAEWLADYQRLLKAIDDIRAEIKTKYESIPGVPWRFKEYDDGWVMALEWTLEIIDKHIGKESE